MKKHLICLSLALSAMAVMTSCSDDPAAGSSLSSKTYSQETLELTYNGEPLVGKLASFNVTSGGNAEITLSGETIDLSEFIGDIPLIGDVATVMPTCGAIPGSASFTFPVKLSGSENECTFSGSAESEYCTFSYEGTVDDGDMTLDLKNVKLKDTTMADASVSLSGIWNVADYDEYNFNSVFRVNWVSEKKPELFPGVEIPIGSVISLAVAMMNVGDQSLGELLTSTLHEVNFGEDGNITALYVDSEDESKTPVKSPANIAQYVVDGDKILVYLNPQAVIANTLKETRAADIDKVLKSVLAAVLPMSTNGIPLSYGKAIEQYDPYGTEGEDPYKYFDYPETMGVYLGTSTLKPILSALAPLLEDEDIRNAIIEMASSDPQFGSMAGMLEPMLIAFPEIVEKSSVIELGINLKR